MTAFDGEMVEALKRFQAENGLAADGVLGEKTWAVLQELATLDATDDGLDGWGEGEVEIIEEPTGVRG